MGTGVLCETWELEVVVIPAKAGIQLVGSVFPKVCGVDSRFRGNDRWFLRDAIPNDATTCAWCCMPGVKRIC